MNFQLARAVSIVSEAGSQKLKDMLISFKIAKEKGAIAAPRERILL